MSDSTRELIVDAAEWIRELAPASPESPTAAAVPELPGPRQPLRVLGYAANGTADAIALGMLGHLVEDLPIEIDIRDTRLQANAIVALLQELKISVLCIADLPPSRPSRYVLKRIRAALPDLRICVGRWAPIGLADDTSDELTADGATHVAATLLETRDYLAGLLDIPRLSIAGPAVPAA